MNKQEAENRVREFVSVQLSLPPEQLFDEASLFHDLGVDGDDAIEFLEAFSCRFSVDVTAVDMAEYFGQERAANPWTFMQALFGAQPKRLKRLEVRHLVDAAVSGVLRGGVGEPPIGPR